MQLKKENLNIISLIFLTGFSFISSIYFLPSTITDGDVAELVGAASSLGIAHAPGYPLFCILYKCLITLLPFGDYAYKAAVVSLFIYMFSGLLIFKLTFIKKNFLFGFFIFTFYLSQPILLKQSTIAEVFSLHNLLVVLIFYFIFSDDISLHRKFLITGFILGLGSGCQHIIIFIIPAIIFYFLSKSPSNILTFKNISLFLVFFLLGFSINLYIPIRSSVEPLYDWEDPQTLDRFLYLFLRKRYGSFSLAQGGKLHFSLESFYHGFMLFFYIFGVKNLIFLVSSILIFLLKMKKIELINSITALIAFLFSGPIFTSITGLKSISESNIYILERLIVSSVISFVFLIIFTFSVFKDSKILLYGLMILNLLFYFRNLNSISLRNNYFLYDYTMNIFRNTPPDSILLSDRADETEFALAYFHRIHKKRQDIDFIDCNASVSRSIYGKEYYKIWGPPRLKIRSEFETKLIKNSRKKVLYNTLLPAQTSTKKYKFALLHTTSETNYEIPFDIFVIREKSVLNIREFWLYNAYLSLLFNYYFEKAIKDKRHFKKFEILCYQLYFLNKEPKYLTYIPYFYMSTNELKKAKNKYVEILDNYKLSADILSEILSNLGVIYERENNFQKAEEYFLKALSVNPNFYQPYYNLGSLYWKMKNFKKALEFFEKYLLLQPQNKEVKKYVEYLKSKL